MEGIKKKIEKLRVELDDTKEKLEDERREKANILSKLEVVSHLNLMFINILLCRAGRTREERSSI